VQINPDIQARLGPVWHRTQVLTGFRRGTGPKDYNERIATHRQGDRRSYTVSTAIHLGVILISLATWQGCRHKVPAGVPMGKGDKLALGKVVVIRTPKKVRRKRRVRKSPVSVFEMIKDEDLQEDQRTAKQFSDSVGVPGGIGKGASAAGSPRGTALGGKLYFYRVKFDGPNWNANRTGVRPLMKEVLKAGVVKKISGFNNIVSLNDLPKHGGEYLPNLLYMTGTGPIKASGKEIENLRNYLQAGGMLFADVSGGDFHDHFVSFLKRVLPQAKLRPIEYDHEVYRGNVVPYAMLRGCPIYRKHRGAGPALGAWIGPRVAVFYSRGDLGSGWGAAGIFKSRRRSVEQAFRMGVNIVSYSLVYYRYQETEDQG